MVCFRPLAIENYPFSANGLQHLLLSSPLLLGYGTCSCFYRLISADLNGGLCLPPQNKRLIFFVTPVKSLGLQLGWHLSAYVFAAP